MRFLANIVVLLVTICSSTHAVTIRNYRTGTCKGDYAQCSNVSPRDCCDLSHNRVFSSSLFLGLPTTAIGAICSRKGNLHCGIVQKAGHGLSLCLGKGNSRGSYWFDCRSCRKGEIDGGAIDLESMSEVNNATSTVSPDIIAIEDRQFNIGGDTPQHVTDGLIEHFYSDGDYSSLPEEYKIYELAELIGDD
ncbi:hypothetical protein N7501_002606 [Penicillium viridicatum]|nr:hypothetical protein N7501_002606 [Penicillium viridicatum]